MSPLHFTKQPTVIGSSQTWIFQTWLLAIFIRSLRNDSKIAQQSNVHFQNYIVMATPTKNSIFGRFSCLPPVPPPLKNAYFIFIVVSPSLIYVEALFGALLRPFQICTLLRFLFCMLAFVLIFALFCVLASALFRASLAISFALICVFLRPAFRATAFGNLRCRCWLAPITKKFVGGNSFSMSATTVALGKVSPSS